MTGTTREQVREAILSVLRNRPLGPWAMEARSQEAADAVVALLDGSLAQRDRVPAGFPAAAVIRRLLDGWRPLMRPHADQFEWIMEPVDVAAEVLHEPMTEAEVDVLRRVRVVAVDQAETD